MWNGILNVVPFQVNFLTCFLPDHNKMYMASANIDALYAGKIRIKTAYVFSK